jgi:hypothetical protein
MALVLADRVRETTTTAGTGTITLLGAVPSCQSFAAVGNGNTTYYTIVAYSGTEWEVGIGTYTASGTTLSRDTVLSSSNSGSLVNFSAGTKDVFVDYPAGRAVYEDAAGNVDGYPITGGTINNTTIGATTPSTGVFTTLTATGQTSLGGASGSESLRVLTPVSAAGLRLQVGVPSSSVVRLGPAGSSVADFRLLAPTFINFYTGSTSDGLLDGAAQMRVSNTASAVNYVQVTGAATSNSPQISFTGSDAGVGGALIAKGNGAISFFNNGATTSRQFRVGAGVVTTAVNYINADGSATGNATQFQTLGTDTNIAMALRSKGTGAIDLAAGSSGVNISNGGTVTAITRTAAGSGYTSFPSVAITAPTTAGGVQATASVTGMSALGTAVVVNGGAGYTAGDVLTPIGGTGGAATRITVSTVSGGVITAASITANETYTVLPTNPVSVTGGTGSGATFNLNYAITGQSITNAGSGYVEQPTVSFSGGGGSGAAAYATVGSGTTVRSLGSTVSFVTPGGISTSQPSFQIAETGAGVSNYLKAIGASGVPYLQADGAVTNISTAISSKGTGSVSFFTNSANQSQMVVAHTASAVNYVQVTGAATGSSVVVSSQGSDTNIGMIYNFKGTASHSFNGNNGTHFQVTSVASGANFLRATGAAASSAPVLSAQGSDTNIDLTLNPKGTGQVKATNATNMIVSSIGQGGFGSFLAQSSTGSAYLFGYSGGSEVGRVYFSSANSVGIATSSAAAQQFVVTNTASAVNYVQVTGAATGAGGTISAQGSDTNIPIFIQAKNSGWVESKSNGKTAFIAYNASSSAVNYIQVDGKVSGTGPSISALGSDTNIDLTLTPKGTGNVRFGTYTGTISAITGYIEIKDSGGTVRRLAVVA